MISADLEVNCQPWAEVWLDGAPTERTPITLENLVLGPHLVRQGSELYLEASYQEAQDILRQALGQPGLSRPQRAEARRLDPTCARTPR